MLAPVKLTERDGGKGGGGVLYNGRGGGGGSVNGKPKP